MNTIKYTVPNLPAAQNILEDLFDAEIMRCDEPLDLSAEGEIIRNAYSCFQNYKQLDSDVQEQTSLSSNLEDLNKKLVENIGNMKKQSHPK